MIHFDLDHKSKQIASIEEEMMAEGFWDDHAKSQSTIQNLNQLKKIVQTHQALSDSFNFLSEGIEMIKDEFDDEFYQSLIEEYKESKEKYDAFSVLVLLNEDYDQKNAVLEIHPGAGGTESQDFASMLYRMYTRWAQKNGFKLEVLNYLDGEEAGLKSVTLSIKGPFAYGYLKAEKGVHRLVRISPFDSSGRRHTSFVSVEVAPEFDDSIEITINPEDISVDTMRATGAGGQHINKTDSAVRITHKETGIVVTCQSGRSQIQNREEALRMLKSKLYQREIEEREAHKKDLAGDQKLIEWGSQIRSYVIHPYAMVKDHRTDVETSQVDDVFDGDLDLFIESYLKANVGG